MPYTVECAELWDSIDSSIEKWVLPIVKGKIVEIERLSNPRSMGGKYQEQWAYPAGKLHIIAAINDDTQVVRLRKLIKLP